MMRLMTSLLVAALMLAPRAVNAQLVSVDDPVFGPGAVTRDQGTGLEWLDINRTTNRSFTDVAAQFGPGGSFEGWRHASATEAQTFWQHAGILDQTGSEVPENHGPITALQALIGTTSNNGTFVKADGHVSDVPFAGYTKLAKLALNQTDQTGSATTESSWPVNFPLGTIGHWLVRAAAPTPDPDPEPEPDPDPDPEPGSPSARDLLARLIGDVSALPQSWGRSLLAKLEAAMKNLSDGRPQNDGGAAGPVSAFVHEVQAQRGKRVPAVQADAFVAAANAVLAAIGR